MQVKACMHPIKKYLQDPYGPPMGYGPPIGYEPSPMAYGGGPVGFEGYGPPMGYGYQGVSLTSIESQEQVSNFNLLAMSMTTAPW